MEDEAAPPAGPAPECSRPIHERLSEAISMALGNSTMPHEASPDSQTGMQIVARGEESPPDGSWERPSPMPWP
jgi:hypothetical protein